MSNAMLSSAIRGCRLRFLSTVAQPLERSHEAETASTVHCLSRKEVESCFQHKIPRRLKSQVQLIGKLGWVFRGASSKIIHDLKHKPPHESRYVLHGADGCGKTVCLLQVLNFCHQSDWIVAYVPSIFTWTHSLSGLKESIHHRGHYELPSETGSWLQQFLAISHKSLAKIQLSRDYECAESGSELIDLVQKGVQNPKLSTEVFKCVFEELSLLSNSRKVILAIDNFNGCFNSTSFFINQIPIASQQLSVVKCLSEHVTSPKFKGAIVTALSRTGARRSYFKTTTPEELLGVEGGKVVEDFKLFKVPPFSRSEVESYLDFLQSQTLCVKELDQSARDELWHLSEGNPHELSRLCAPL